MELSEDLVKEFEKIHEPYGILNGLNETQKREVAQGVANYYIILFNIAKRIEKHQKKTG